MGRLARARREEILRIVEEQAIGTQEELARALRARGFSCSQASVSRDVAALGLVKAGGRYVRPRAVPPEDPAAERVARFVLSADRAGDHLVVLHTPPGEASGVALALDRLGRPGVVGTVAGDDTIFVAVTGGRAAAALLSWLDAIRAG